MKKNMLQTMLLLLLFFLSTNGRINAEELLPTKVAHIEKDSFQIEMAIIESVVFTILAKVLLNKNEPLSLVKSIGYGVGSWGFGEIAEAVYKEAFKAITNKNMRTVLGESKILGITVDNQRVLRRLVTLAMLSTVLYIAEK